VYLDTPLPILLERYDQRGDEHIQRNDLIKIWGRYDWYYKRTEMKKIRVNTMNENWLKELIKFLEE
jgi:hypothetical protein